MLWFIGGAILFPLEVARILREGLCWVVRVMSK